MPKQDWRGHWLFGILDIWLSVVVVVEFFSYWRRGWIGVLGATALLALVIAGGFVLEKLRPR